MSSPDDSWIIDDAIPDAPEAGVLIADRYRILGELGQGQLGIVFRAEDFQLPRQVALKLLRVSSDPARAERMRREGQLAAALRHPGIVRIHDSGLHEGRPFLIYECIEGEALRPEELDRCPRTERLDLLESIALALGHAHGQGVIHRDLKFSNVLLDAEGRPRLTDFGLGFSGARHDRMTRTGERVGTPRTMSPEQIRAESCGPESDVWALGVLLYRLLCGRYPFAGTSLGELATEILQAMPPTPRSLKPSLPPALEAVCMRALAKAPEDRYQNATEMAAALREAREAQWTGTPPALQALAAVIVGGLLIATLFAPGSPGHQSHRASNPQPKQKPKTIPRANPAEAFRHLLRSGQLKAAESLLQELSPEFGRIRSSGLRLELARVQGTDLITRLMGDRRSGNFAPRHAAWAARSLLIDGRPTQAIAAVGLTRRGHWKGLEAQLEEIIELSRAALTQPPDMARLTRAEPSLGRGLARYFFRSARRHRLYAARLEDPRFTLGAAAMSRAQRLKAARDNAAWGAALWPSAPTTLAAQRAPLGAPQRPSSTKIRWRRRRGSLIQIQALIGAGESQEARAKLASLRRGKDDDSRVLEALLGLVDGQKRTVLEARIALLRGLRTKEASASHDQYLLALKRAPQTEARRLLTQTLALDPVHWRARYSEGSFELLTGEVAQGWRLIFSAARFRPKMAFQMAAHLQHFVGAVKLFRQPDIDPRRAFPQDPEGRLARAVTASLGLIVQGSPPTREAQLAALDRCLEGDPSETLAWIFRAFLLIRMGRLDEARRDLAVASKAIPDCALIDFLEALALAREGRPAHQVAAVLARSSARGDMLWDETGWSLELYPELRPYAEDPQVQAVLGKH